MKSHDAKRAAGADFDAMAAEYQFWMEHQAADRLVAGARKLMRDGGTVLDAGCGDGTMSVALAPYCRHVVAIDLSAEMLALARQKMRAAGVGNVQLVNGDLRQLAVAGSQFDLVISSMALHHLPVDSSLPLLAQAVKPGGWLILQEPACPVHGALRPLWYRWQGLRSTRRALGKHGFRTAWRIGCFEQSSAWIQHQLADAHWDACQWRASVARALPDAIVQLSADHSIMTVLWQRATPENSAVISPAVDAAGALGDRRPGGQQRDAPTQVGRYYPRPAPSDYVPFPRAALEGSVVARFEAQVAAYEGRTALRGPNLVLSYGQLNAAANRIAHSLLSWAPARSARVSILMDQDDPVIPAIFGVLKAGLAYVALDPADAPERQARIVAQAGSEIVLTTAARAAIIDNIAKMAGNPLRSLVWEELDGGPDTNPGLPLGPDHLAAIFFTSGSTGEPKGVARDHRQYLHSTWLNTNTYYVAPTDRQSLLYFPGFTASVPNIYDTLLNGATLCCLNPRRMVPSALLDWLRFERITHFNPPIGLWRGLLDAMPQNVRWPDLRLVTLAGQQIYGRDIRDFQARFGPDTVLLYVLAMSETGAVTQGYIDAGTVAGDGPVPVGYEVADKEIAVVDEAGVPVPPGETGRIAISSAYLSLGYWPDTACAGFAFQTSGEPANLRTFLSGDRGRFQQDGCLEHIGRADTIVKVRGYRVDTAAVEAALNTCPQLSQAAVMAVPQSGGDTSLIAYISGKENGRRATMAVRSHLAQLLPHYMIPERIVWLDIMPLTASGKLDRQALSPAGTIRPALITPYGEPHTTLERQLADLWAEMLELDRVGVNDNLFDLGSDSITAIRLIAKIERAQSCRVPSAFFGLPTIANLARLISMGTQEGESAGEVAEEAAAAAAVARTERSARAQWNGLLNRAVQRGPLWRDRALPYAAGVRLQHRWIRMPLLAGELRRRSSVLQPWLAGTQDSRRQEILELSMLANTWSYWRNHCLRQPATLHRWVDVTGLDILDDILRLACPIVLIGVHTGVHNGAAIEVIRRRSQRATGVLNYSPHGNQEANANAAKAYELLLAGGIVFVAGDGSQGTKGVVMPLGGKPWLFRTGAAELALSTRATMLPVFTTLHSSGRIQVSFQAPLRTTDESQRRLEYNLTEQYATLLDEHWPWLLGSMSWKKLRQIIDYMQ